MIRGGDPEKAPSLIGIKASVIHKRIILREA
jgi:hypothetical protein